MAPPPAIDARLAALGIHRIAVPVPFPDAGGPVNVYVLEEPDGFSLFDTGVGTPEAEALVDEGLARLGLSPSSLRRIFLSHGHADHYGQARRLREASQAPVFAHRLDWDKAQEPNPWPELRSIVRDYFVQLGMPEAEWVFVEQLRAHAESMAPRLPAGTLQPLEAGAWLDFRHFRAQVLHAPGHTPGLVCLHLPEERVLLADDHVLARVSPNPLLELDRRGPQSKFRSLAAYLDSARRVLELNVEWVLPGHGPPFADYRPILESLFAFYRKRQAKIRDALRAQAATPYELIPVVFGKRDSGRLFLTMSEVIGNLEVMEEAGEVSRQEHDGVLRFRA